MIEVKNLTKEYGDKVAVNDISFSIEKGEIVGLLGPNGAGKSTTMNMITGYTSITKGSISVNGADVLGNPIKAKRSIGYLPEQPPLYLDMTVDEYLKFVFDLKNVKLRRLSHLEHICELVGIANVRRRVIKNLSKGYRQRVGLAQAMIGDPECLILDEPTVGLDPKQILEIRDVIRGLASKSTVILSSHILPEISAVAQRVIIIDKGKIVAQGTTDSLSSSVATPFKFNARISGDPETIIGALESIEGMGDVTLSNRVGEHINDYVFDGVCDLREMVFYALSDVKCPILLMKPNDVTLEDVFIKLTTQDNFDVLDELEDAEHSEDEETAEILEGMEAEETESEAEETVAEDAESGEADKEIIDSEGGEEN